MAAAAVQWTGTTGCGRSHRPARCAWCAGLAVRLPPRAPVVDVTELAPFGIAILSFSDPDGVHLELTATLE